MTMQTEDQSYVTECGMYAAIPYVKGQFIVIHNGQQIRCCRSLTTAKRFITKEKNKLK
jgi:hypothetical protein